MGGCNGALIRFEETSKLERNAPLKVAKSIDALAPIKASFGDGLAWADLIVLAGHTAIEMTLGMPLDPFCPGRSDAPLFPSAVIQPTHAVFNFAKKEDIKEAQTLLGLTAREMVALNGMIHVLAMPGAGDLAAECEGLLHTIYAHRCELPALEIKYFQTLLAGGHDLVSKDMALLEDPVYKTIVQDFAATDGKPLFVGALSSAWTKLANADRFDGPLKNVCDAPAATAYASASLASEPAAMQISPAGGLAVLVLVVAAFAVGMLVGKKRSDATLVDYDGKYLVGECPPPAMA